MKVLYLTSSFPYGQGEAFFLPEIKELRKRGNKVLIIPILPKGDIVHSEAKLFEDLTLSEPLLSLKIVFFALSLLITSPIEVFTALASIFTTNPFHLVKNISIVPKAFWIAIVAKKWGADHIHAHWASTTSSTAMVASIVSGITWSYTAHRWDILDGNILLKKTQKSIGVRFISSDGASEALLHGLTSQIIVEKATIIKMGVEVLQMDNNIPRISKPSEEIFRFACVASLTSIKGHIYLFEAVLKIMDLPFTLTIIGDGPLRRELEEVVAKLGIAERVSFLGHLPNESVFQLYRNNEIDAIVLPSLHEGLPVSLIEALVFKIPVVATAVGGTPELIGDGCGILIPPSNPEEISKAMRELILNQELRERVVSRGFKKVVEEYKIERVVDRLLMLFEGRR